MLYSEIPRKITLFRCVIEKKLGIDWEHSIHESELNSSIQTDMQRDGYEDVQTVTDGLGELSRTTSLIDESGGLYTSQWQRP